MMYIGKLTEPFTLSEPELFSDEFNDFISKCLAIEPKLRNLEELEVSILE